MTRMACLIAALSLLAACGVDGEPTRPEPKAKSGLTVSGRVEMGVTGS